MQSDETKQVSCWSSWMHYAEIRTTCIMKVFATYCFFQTEIDPNCPEIHSAWAGCVARPTFTPQYCLTNARLWLSLLVTYPKYWEAAEWFSSFFSIWTTNKIYASSVVSVLCDWKGWCKPVRVSGGVHTGKSLAWAYTVCKKYHAFQLDVQAQWVCMLIKHHLKLFVSIHMDMFWIKY